MKTCAGPPKAACVLRRPSSRTEQIGIAWVGEEGVCCAALATKIAVPVVMVN